MSNEYKDWCWDAAQDYLVNEVYMIEEVEYMTEFNDGYLMICRYTDGSRAPYFVWNDDDYGWSYKEIIV